jgi:hypothetical protein
MEGNTGVDAVGEKKGGNRRRLGGKIIEIEMAPTERVTTLRSSLLGCTKDGYHLAIKPLAQNAR